MKTMIGMVTIGKSSATRERAVNRAQCYARRHGYEFAQIHSPVRPGTTRTPHWEKTLVPQAFPGYERYWIIDDDILINHRLAPALPAVDAGKIGLVREPLPEDPANNVPWVGNTGVMLLEHAGLDLLTKAYDLGEYKDVPPGYGDQPAVNVVAWRENRVTRLEWKWNYLLMADWLMCAHGQEYPWTKSQSLGRLAKATLTLRLMTRDFWRRSDEVVARLRQAYEVHLTWYRMGANLVDQVLG